jgi:hypothetical protein
MTHLALLFSLELLRPSVMHTATRLLQWHSIYHRPQHSFSCCRIYIACCLSESLPLARGCRQTIHRTCAQPQLDALFSPDLVQIGAGPGDEVASGGPAAAAAGAASGGSGSGELKGAATLAPAPSSQRTAERELTIDELGAAVAAMLAARPLPVATPLPSSSAAGAGPGSGPAAAAPHTGATQRGAASASPAMAAQGGDAVDLVSQFKRQGAVRDGGAIAPGPTPAVTPSTTTSAPDEGAAREPPPSASELSSLVALLDVNGNGRLSRQELVSGLKACRLGLGLGLGWAGVRGEGEPVSALHA